LKAGREVATLNEQHGAITLPTTKDKPMASTNKKDLAVNLNSNQVSDLFFNLSHTTNSPDDILEDAIEFAALVGHEGDSGYTDALVEDYFERL
jgi:hypothetical protein